MVGIKSYTILQQILFASYGALLYIVKLFVPYKLSAFYPYPDVIGLSVIPLIFYLAPLIVLGIFAALIYFFRKKEKELVFGLLFYFVSVALVLQFISVGSAIIADRYTYLSYIGLLFIVAYLLNKLWQHKGSIWALMKYPLVVIIIAAAVVFSYETYSRTQVWKDSDTLWTNVIDNYPDAATAYFNRANNDYDLNEIDKAVSDYTNALQWHSDIDSHKKIYFDRGLLYYNYYHKYDLAIADYTNAIAVDDTFRRGYYDRGLAYSDEGKYDLAIADFSTSIKLSPDNAEGYSSRGTAYFKNGKYDSALDDYNEAVALDPGKADYYNNRGSLYMNTGKNDLALADYNKAIAFNPSMALYYYNRGLCYNALNQYQNAVDDLTKEIQADPQNALVCNVIGICYMNLKNYNEAITYFSKAIDLNPSVAGFWLNRSVAESKTGRNDDAKADELKGKQLQGK
jgi:tetratricopeptide (TPR) repeat protein